MKVFEKVKKWNISPGVSKDISTIILLDYFVHNVDERKLESLLKNDTDIKEIITIDIFQGLGLDVSTSIEAFEKAFGRLSLKEREKSRNIEILESKYLTAMDIIINNFLESKGIDVNNVKTIADVKALIATKTLEEIANVKLNIKNYNEFLSFIKNPPLGMLKWVFNEASEIEIKRSVALRGFSKDANKFIEPMLLMVDYEDFIDKKIALLETILSKENELSNRNKAKVHLKYCYLLKEASKPRKIVEHWEKVVDYDADIIDNKFIKEVANFVIGNSGRKMIKKIYNIFEKAADNNSPWVWDLLKNNSGKFLSRSAERLFNLIEKAPIEIQKELYPFFANDFRKSWDDENALVFYKKAVEIGADAWDDIRYTISPLNEKKEKILEEIIEMAPKHEKIRLLLAIADKYRIINEDVSVKYYSMALQENDKSALNAIEKQLRYFKKANNILRLLKYFPQEKAYNVLINLAKYERYRDRYDAAKAFLFYDAAIKIDKSKEDAWIAIQEDIEKLGSRVEKLLEDAPKNYLSYGILVEYGNYLYKKKAWKDAMKMYTEAIILYPKKREAWENLLNIAMNPMSPYFTPPSYDIARKIVNFARENGV
ncbi:MAG: hypothetical protein J7K22_00780, partial [Nanoarchaeota archaeon]|nr:hypothetical protein [Nanoarchaeota archaeon]